MNTKNQKSKKYFCSIHYSNDCNVLTALDSIFFVSRTSFGADPERTSHDTIVHERIAHDDIDSCILHVCIGDDGTGKGAENVWSVPVPKASLRISHSPCCSNPTCIP